MASPAEFTHRYNPQPRLSANQTADYLYATPTNRRSILRDAKFPPTMIVIRYEDARPAMVERFADEGDLDGWIEKIHRKAAVSTTEYQKLNCQLCIDALESFQASIRNLDAGKLRFRRPRRHFSKLMIEGVHISVAIDLVVEGGDGKSVGGAIFVFSKAEKDERKFKAIALLIHELLKPHVKAPARVDPTLCMAIDVFNARIYRGKTQQKMLYNTVEASCEEIATRWPAIKPPANYNGPPISKG